MTVWPANAVDYDTDDDNLIEIGNLAQLDAVRHDLDGDGTPTGRGKTSYDTAFPNALERMGCSLSVGCRGYELTADLDFDTDDDGDVDSGDTYWNDGKGWVPIGGAGSTLDAQVYDLENPFTAIFEGNGHTVSHLFIGSDTVLLVGLFGFAGSSSNIQNLGLTDADVSGPELAAGLVGFNNGEIRGSYVTGRVSGIENVGGLVGINSTIGEIRGSYATSHVSGDDDVGGLVGDNRGEIVASYATGRVLGNTDAGGLIGNHKSTGEISSSYATGTVSGGSDVGGLIGLFEGGSINASYWDTQTSGHATGVLPFGRTTAQLQSPRSYSGIYGSWNLDINGDSVNDDPWDFGTSSQYPALRADRNGDGDATWEEFGHQLRSGPTLTATPTTNAGQSQVELEWTEVPLSSEWTPAPSLSYTVTRDDGATLETIAGNLTVREYTDTDVAGETYVYQVAAVVNGGEAVRSATVSVTVVGNSPPEPVGTLPDRMLRVGDSAMTEVAGAFRDPEGDTITYDVSSSDSTIASVTVAGTRVTMVSVGAGQATITVTATDETGSNKSRTQRFTVTVLPTTTADYDADDDGLIEISNLAQLDAVRHDLDGNGVPTTTGAMSYARAFANGSAQLACGGLFGCVGYELSADPDFDTDNSGEADAGDSYWNGGAGWIPIGDSSDSFSAIFEGNGETVTNLFIDSSGNDVGLFGETTSSAVIRNLELVAVQVTGTDNVGGLVGSNGGAVSGCFATGKVTGDDDVGGLIGSNLNDGAVTVSYSTVQVAGDDRIGGLAGSNRGEVTAAYATGRVVGDSEAGGLIGRNTGDVNVSYATGLVSGRSTIGGLVGRNTGGGAISDSYWDSDTSGRTSGSNGQGQTTAELQLPTAASGIYSAWNVDLDGDGMNDAPWVFGTSSQYPALSVDTNGVGGATWQEFGQQVRAGPNLMATPTVGQVTLTWSAISGGTYNLYRTAGTTVEILSENTSSRAYVDTDVTAGATYVYQVAAVVNGGEGSRSPRVSVEVPMPGVLPTATLELSPAFISENGGSAMVTAKLSHTSSETTTVTVSATANSPALMGDFTLSANRTLTIAAGQANSTGTVTIRANNNNVHAPNKTVRVSGTASNSQGVTGPADVTLTIVDDDTPTVMLELSQTSIGENRGSTTVTARLNRVSSEMTMVRVSAAAVSPAVSRDFTLSANQTLTITAGQTASTETVTITANDNDADTPSKTVRVSGSASNSQGVIGPADVTLTITDDDPAPTVTLRLSRTSITENRGSTTVTARLDRASSETTTVAVSVTPVNPAVEGDFTLSTNQALTIAAGRTGSTGTVTIRATDNDVDTPDKTVRVSGSASNTQGVTDPDDVTLTITDDDSAPKVTLELSQTSISENRGSTAVTAKLDRASSETTTVTVSVTPVNPAVEGDFTLSTNQTLFITAGRTSSTGTVTITANDNVVDAPNKTVRVSGTASNSQGVTDPDDVTLTITDDDAAPVMTLEVDPAVIAEAAGSSTVRVRITNGVTFVEAQEIRLSFSGTAEKDTDYTVDSERLNLMAGEDSVTTPVTAVNDRLVDVDDTILITATHDRRAVGTEQTITITDDDAAPVVATDSPLLVAENETEVATLAATDADGAGEQLEWELAGGADRSKFTLTSDGELTFKAAKDYERPDDANRDGDYEIRVQVSDGFNPVEADFIVRLQDVDDTAPVFSSAVVNGATLTLAYSEELDRFSVPPTGAFTVTGGNQARTVTGVRVSGSAVELTLDPPAEHGETALRVSYTVPTGTGESPIRDTAGNDADRLSNQSVANNTGDTTGPVVQMVRITSNADSDRTYAVDDLIEVTVTFDETVVVTGTPRLTLNLGGGSRTADYQSVTGAAVKFEYRVARGDSDRDGVSIDADSLSRGGGRIRDGAGNDAQLDHAAVAADSRHQVDGVPPMLATTDGAVANGTTLTLAYSEPLNSSSRPAASAFTVTGGNETRTVTRVQVSGSEVLLTLNPAVTDGESGLRLSYQPGGNPIEDTVGNAADGLNNQPVTNNTGDTTGPTVETVRITSNAGSDATYAAGETIEVTVTFSETVVVTGTPRLTLNVGGRSRTANYQDVTGAAVRFEYQVVSGDTAPYGVSIDANRLSGGTIRDGARNDAVLNHAPVAADSRHQVDGVKPTLATSDGAVASGTTLTLAYGEPLDSSSVPATDDFTVTGGSETRTVTGVRVSGSAVFLTLSPAVADRERGLRVSYEPGSDPIQDTAGNDADRLSNQSVTNRTGDTTGPAVSTVRITSSAGSDRTYGVDETIEVTVTFDETVVVTGTPQLTLNLGGRSRTANFRSVMSQAVKFAYRVVPGDNDGDGVSIDADSLSRGAGTIRDGAQNDATLDHAAVAADARHQVDGILPVLATTDGAVVNGTMLTLAYSEPLRSSSRPATSAFTVTGGNETRTVTRVQVSGSAVFLTLSPAVEEGETGLRSSYQPGGNPIEDTVGNAADGLNNQPVTNRTGDTTGPTVETVRITSNAGSDATYAAGETIEVTVTFSETVVVTGTPQLTLNLGGRSRTANYQDVTGAAVRFEYQVVSGDTAPYGVSIEANRLSGGTIRDGARNNAVLNHAPVAADSRHRWMGSSRRWRRPTERWPAARR